ncbi:MAG TPA: TonB-dependent receptor [Longimicrobium sp.]|nr:TonB-dependent receptor [Longimicrobium sp.]
MIRLLAGIVFAILLVPPLHAQEPAPRDTTRLDTVRLPEMTVTATRAPARILDVPLAVTVVGREELRDAQGNRVDQALRTVPGVLAQSRTGGGDLRIVIRGFGARGAGDRSNAGTTRGIRILQDGVPETEPDGRTSMDLVDLGAVEELEVIRSNASALWGNAAGGVVSFSTVPAFDAPWVQAEQQTGGFGLMRHVVRGGQTFGAARTYVMLARTEQDGWRRNSAGERTLLNAGLVAPVGGRTEVRLHALAADNRFGIPGPLTQTALDDDPRQANAVYAQRRERRHNRLARGSVQVEHRAGERVTLQGMLFAQPKRLIRSERGTYREFDRHHAGGTLGARWEHAAAPGRSASLSAGVDLARQGGPGVFYSLTDEGERGTEVLNNRNERARNLGVYAQEQLSAGDLEVVLGARWDAVDYDVKNALKPQLSDERSFTRLSPKLGLLWRLSPTRSVYGGIGGGVEAPAGNETDPVGTFGDDTIYGINPLLRPIRSTTYEVGTKAIESHGAGPVRAFSYDLALYWTEVRDEIIPYRGGRFYFSAGAVRRRGAELGVRVVTAPGVEMDFALTGSDHRYTRYAVDSVHYGRPGATADFSGNRVVGVPDVHGSAALRWAPAFRREAELEVGMQWVDGFWADDANAVRVPGYALWNAGIGLRRPLRLPRGLTARGSLRLENLLDERYVASAFLNPDVVAGEPVAFEPGLPRHAVLTISLGWGR